MIFYSQTGELDDLEPALLCILCGLDRDHFSPVLLCPPGPLAHACLSSADLRHQKVPELHFAVTAHPVKLVRTFIALLITLLCIRRHVKAAKPRLLHATSTLAGLIASIATWNLDLPIIWHLQDTLPNHPLASLSQSIAEHSRQARLLAVSKAAARSFRESTESAARRLSKPISIIYNSVDCDRFRPDPLARTRMRTALELEGDQVAIGVLGCLSPTNNRLNQLALIEAFAGMRDRIPQAVLVFISPSLPGKEHRALTADLARRTRQLGLDPQVRFTSIQDDLPAILNALDLLAQSSTDSPGEALMAAFATGLTAVVPRGGIACELVEDRITAFLAKPADLNDLLSWVEFLVNDPGLRHEMGRQTRQKMQKEFARSGQTRRINAYYFHLLAKTSPYSIETVAA